MKQFMAERNRASLYHTVGGYSLCGAYLVTPRAASHILQHQLLADMANLSILHLTLNTEKSLSGVVECASHGHMAAVFSS